MPTDTIRLFTVTSSYLATWLALNGVESLATEPDPSTPGRLRWTYPHTPAVRELVSRWRRTLDEFTTPAPGAVHGSR